MHRGAATWGHRRSRRPHARESGLGGSRPPTPASRAPASGTGDSKRVWFKPPCPLSVMVTRAALSLGRPRGTPPRLPSAGTPCSTSYILSSQPAPTRPRPGPSPPFPSRAGWPNEGFLAGPSLFSCPAGCSWPGGQRPHSRPQPAPHPHGAVHSPGVQNLPPSSGGLTVRPVQPHLPPGRCPVGALRHLCSPRQPRRPRPQGALRLPARCHSAASSACTAAGGVPFRVCLCGAWLPLRLVFEFLTFWLLCHGWWVDLGCWLMAGRRGRVGPGGGQLALCTPVLKPSPVAGDGGESISLEV